MLSTLHARAAFRLRPRDGDGWPDVLAPILSWLAGRERALLPPQRLTLLTEGGGLREGRVSIATMLHRGAGGAAHAWALAYTRPDVHDQLLRWHIDLAVSREGEGWRFALASSTMRDLGAGEDAPPPEPAMPYVVQKVLSDARFICDGPAGWSLGPQPQRLAPGQAHRLLDALTARGRLHPVVYVSRGSAALPDVARLAAQLAGAAPVIVATTPALDAELDHLLPKGFRTVGGAVRVYLPGIDLADPADAQRHRYLPAEDVASGGREAVARIIQAVLRANVVTFQDWPTTIRDVQTLAREARLSELRLRAETDQAQQAAYIALLEETNAALTAERTSLQAALDRLDVALADREATIRRLIFTAQGAQPVARPAPAAPALHALREFPKTLPAMLDLIAGLFPDRVRVTERALASAEVAAIGATREVRLCWRVLHALATDLYDLVFADAPVGDLPRRFQERTGIELALSESSATQANPRLMALRRSIDDEGLPIDITPHLKVGDRPPRMLRVHFAIDRARRLLIVDHCGDHLETAGTARST
ncbi:MAG TPA: hypothetical protein VNL77_17695 [Roseiflexaceae bacterium]|nr:hypothetical protein [Roseiflexaceae bacterium]